MERNPNLATFEEGEGGQGQHIEKYINQNKYKSNFFLQICCIFFAYVSDDSTKKKKLLQQKEFREKGNTDYRFLFRFAKITKTNILFDSKIIRLILSAAAWKIIIVRLFK